jgi:hypothetical protein
MTPEAVAAVQLWRLGLRPVPLLPIGAIVRRPGNQTVESDGKVPIGEDWAASDYTSESALRQVYRMHPGAGVGLALGLMPDGSRGLVDLEIDDPAMAAESLEAIFGAAGPPRTAGWTSARGEHRGYMMYPEDARRLLAAGITQAALDGRLHPCLRGLEPGSVRSIPASRSRSSRSSHPRAPAPRTAHSPSRAGTSMLTQATSAFRGH